MTVHKKTKSSERLTDEQQFATVEELNAFLFRAKKRKLHRLKNLGRELGTRVAKQRMAELEKEF